MSHNELLQKEGIFYRGSDVEHHILYVMGDMEKDIRTHHIHVVKWNGRTIFVSGIILMPMRR